MPAHAHAHLTAEGRVIADLDDARRIAHLAEEYWIDYPRARQVLQELERLLGCPERTRMPGLLLAVEMPSAPQERRLYVYGQLLMALNALYRPGDRLAAME